MLRFIHSLFLAIFISAIAHRSKAAPNDPDADSNWLIDITEIFEKQFPDKDPETLDCDDINIFYNLVNIADSSPARMGEFRMKGPRMIKRSEAMKKKVLVKKNTKRAIRSKRYQRKPSERQKAIRNRMKECGCWSRRRASARLSTSNRGGLKTKSNVQSGETLTRRPLETNQFVIGPIQIEESRPANRNTPSRTHTGDTVLRSGVPNSLKPPGIFDKLNDRLNHFKQTLGSSLQLLESADEHFDRQLLDPWKQDFVGENVLKRLKDITHKGYESDLPSPNNKPQSGQFSDSADNRNNVPQQNMEKDDGTIEDGNGTTANIYMDSKKTAEEGDEYWYKIFIGCLLGLCGVLTVSLALVFFRRRRNKKADTVDYKFDLSLKKPSVYVSETSASVSEKKVSHVKENKKQLSQNSEKRPYDSIDDSSADVKLDDVNDDACAKEPLNCSEYENIAKPPTYFDVIGTENYSDLEQHV